MKDAVGYIFVHRLSIPGDPDSPRLYFARPKARDVVTFDELAEEVGNASTTVSDTDVLAVLNEVDKAVVRHLEAGHIVHLGGICTLQTGFSSEGVESPEKFHTSMIHSPKVYFRPGERLVRGLKNLKFRKVEGGSTDDSGEDPGDPDNPGEPSGPATPQIPDGPNSPNAPDFE